MILYIENPKDSTRKLISEFSKIAGHKINIYRSVTFLYTNNVVSEREIKETVPFTITSKVVNNLPKKSKDLYLENYDADKEIVDDTNK